MKNYQDIFERYEKKYLLTREQYHSLNQQLSEKMKLDEYGKHTICNVYYDTDQYDLIRASIEKPVYKEKLRLRSYGIATPDSIVFLELKKKYKKIVYKRRIPFTLHEANRYLSQGIHPSKNSQILNEIDYFLEKYPVSEKAYICYDRIALFGRDNKNLRITFDDNIRFRQTSLRLDRGTWGTEILTPGTMLMEIKILGTFELWLSKLLSQLQIYPTSYSKYGTCYQHYLKDSFKAEGGRINA